MPEDGVAGAGRKVAEAKCRAARVELRDRRERQGRAERRIGRERRAVAQGNPPSRRAGPERSDRAAPGR